MKTTQITIAPGLILNAYGTKDEAFENENGDCLFTNGFFWVCFSDNDIEAVKFFFLSGQKEWIVK